VVCTSTSCCHRLGSLVFPVSSCVIVSDICCMSAFLPFPVVWDIWHNLSFIYITHISVLVNDPR
jgi:hypothetical protein